MSSKKLVPPVIDLDGIYTIPTSTLDLKEALDGAAALKSQQLESRPASVAGSESKPTKGRRRSSITFGLDVEEGASSVRNRGATQFETKKADPSAIYGNAPATEIVQRRKSKVLLGSLGPLTH